jgi:hypothetical protein
VDQDAGPSAPAAEEVPVEIFTGAESNGCDPADADPNGCDLARADPNGCDPAPFMVRIVDEDEEEEVPLIRKNSRRYRVSGGSSDIPSPALSALVSLQELSITDFDRALEDVVPKDMLSEPTDGDMMDLCSEIPDAKLEASRAASRTSSTLEDSVQCQEVGHDRPTPMEVAEGPSALEVAVAKNPVLKGGAGGCPASEGVVGNDPTQVGSASCDPAPEGAVGDDLTLMGSASGNPAPEGVRASSPSHTSMDVHVGSSLPHSGGIIAAHALDEGVTLEVGVPDAGITIFASGAESIPDDALQIVPANIPSSSYDPASHDLGFSLLFSNLQVA